MDNTTIQLEWQAGRCETLPELAAMLRQLDSRQARWQIYLTRLLDESGCGYSQFAARCGLSRDTVKKWCVQGGMPQNRDTFLKIGLGTRMEPEQVDGMLRRYGGYPGLNPRDPFDAAVLFCLRRQLKTGEALDFSAAQALYRRCLPQEPAPPENEATAVLMGRLYQADTEKDLAAFLRQYGAGLTGRRPRLEQYLSEFLTARCLALRRQTGRGTLHALGLPAQVEKQLSLMKTQGVIPRRKTLLALGIWLDMTQEELDQLLCCAGMDPLYARDRLECALLYVLQSLSLTHPELALGNATALLAITRDAATRSRCAALAEEYWQAAYRSEESEDLDSVRQYLKDLLEQLDLDEARELLEFL